jgi:hypothetical protein
MRFMMIVKATKDSDAGKMPSDELIAAVRESSRREREANRA